jgi:hypothetical protein
MYIYNVPEPVQAPTHRSEKTVGDDPRGFDGTLQKLPSGSRTTHCWEDVSTYKATVGLLPVIMFRS